MTRQSYFALSALLKCYWITDLGRCPRLLHYAPSALKLGSMNDQDAHEIAKTVVHDTQFWIAIVGLLGVVVGTLATAGSTLLVNWLRGRKQTSLDNARKNLLRKLLGTKDWRKLSTLSRVIGSDSEETRRLLIAIEARGSEVPREDGDEVWGLISRHPLAEIE